MSYLDQTLRVLPEAILSVFGTLVMVLSPLVKRPRTLGYLALAGLVLALGGAVWLANHQGPAFGGQILSDGFSVFFRALFILIAIAVVCGSFDYLERDGLESGEYYALVLLSVVGQGLMAAAAELVLLFIALEISSLATYVLAGYRRGDPRSAEAALKYFLLGSFATAFLLYGIALVYGATGSTQLPEIRAALSRGAPALVGVATALMFVGLAFKISSAPFQIWAPDVYQGAPAPVTALLSAGPKAAAFAVFLRVFITGLSPDGGYFWLLWFSAALSMFVGNLAALVQGNIKRMLAYSSVAHAGYVLVAFSARSESGVAAALFYLCAYAVMNVGAFMVVAHFANTGEKYVDIADYCGLGRKHPALAACLTVFLLSLIGMPLTGGFFGKFYIVTAAVHARLTGLAVLAVINSAIAAYYYLRVIVAMYMEEGADDVPVLRLPAAAALVLLATVAGTFYLGVFPSQILDWATRSAASFR
jgi:NADH-quinone oxidoreductase subunit N